MRCRMTTDHVETPPEKRSPVSPALLLASVMLLLGLALLRYTDRAEAIHPNRPFDEFPLTIGQWRGERAYFTPEVYDVLGVDDSFLATYTGPDGRPVQLYIGFYQSQRKGDLIHSPKNCLPGAGWRIADVRPVPLSSSKVGGENVTVNEMSIRKDTHTQMVYYWFHSQGRILSSEYAQKIYLVLDAVTRHRTDGAFIRLISPVVGGDDAKTRDLIHRFAGEIMPVLSEFLPS